MSGCTCVRRQGPPSSEVITIYLRSDPPHESFLIFRKSAFSLSPEVSHTPKHLPELALASPPPLPPMGVSKAPSQKSSNSEIYMWADKRGGFVEKGRKFFYYYY